MTRTRHKRYVDLTIPWSLCLALTPALTLAPGCGDDGRTTESTTDAASSTTEGSAGTTEGSASTSAGTAATSDAGTGGATGTTTSDATTSGSTAATDATSTTDDPTGSSTTDDWMPTPGALCEPIPNCLAALPGDPDIEEALNHRGRDMFYVEGEDQWVLAKFAEAGILDFDLENEEIEIYVLRGCEGEFEYLGTATTTDDGDHPTIEGIEDTGGRLYFKIPDDQKLEPGRHRIHMIVTSDNSRADQYIDVVPPGAPMFVSDIDGTLTTAEFEEFLDLLIGDIPDSNDYANEALTILREKGYRPMYVTARPEFLYKRSREFVETRGFPNGIIHTSLSKDGALGDEAVTYKTNEFAMLEAKGLKPAFVFGNTESDAEAYQNADIQPLEHRIFFQFDDAFGGRTINTYFELLEEFEALPSHCEPP